MFVNTIIPDNPYHWGNYECPIIGEGCIVSIVQFQHITDATIDTIYQLPYHFDVNKTEPLVIRNTIPDDLPNGAKLAIKSYMQSVIVKIDGETVYAVGNDSNKFLGSYFAKFWAVADIEPEHKGKTVEFILFSNLSSSHGYVSEVIIASGTGLLRHIFSKKVWGMFWSRSLLFLVLYRLSSLNEKHILYYENYAPDDIAQHNLLRPLYTGSYPDEEKENF